MKQPGRLGELIEDGNNSGEASLEEDLGARLRHWSVIP